MIKVSFEQAQKLFDEGQTVRLVPSKMGPNNAWGVGFDFRKDDEALSFSKLVRIFEAKHCSPTVGRRAAFYVAENQQRS